jgi:hypothetical protein
MLVGVDQPPAVGGIQQRWEPARRTADRFAGRSGGRLGWGASDAVGQVLGDGRGHNIGMSGQLWLG